MFSASLSGKDPCAISISNIDKDFSHRVAYVGTDDLEVLEEVDAKLSFAVNFSNKHVVDV